MAKDSEVSSLGPISDAIRKAGEERRAAKALEPKRLRLILIDGDGNWHGEWAVTTKDRTPEQMENVYDLRKHMATMVLRDEILGACELAEADHEEG